MFILLNEHLDEHLKILLHAQNQEKAINCLRLATPMAGLLTEIVVDDL